MGTKGSAVIAAAFALAALFVQSCQRQEPIRLGYMGGLTGRNGDLGIAGRDGVLLAVETINAGGGVNGKRLDLLIRDDKSDVEEAKRVVGDLVSAKVAAVVGPMTSVVAMAAVPLVNDAKVLSLSPTVSTSDLAGKDDHFIRLNLNWDTAAASADHLVDALRIKKAALIYDTSNRSYTGSLADAFKARLIARGGTLTAEQTFNAREDTDLRTLARKVVAVKPPAVFVIAGAVDSAMVCQQLRKLGSRAVIFIAEWAGTSEFPKAGGKAVEGVYSLQHFNNDSKALSFTDFRERYLKRFGDPPNFAGTYSYEAVMMIAEALRQDPDPHRLKDTIIRIGTFQGLQGPFTVDRFGDPVRPYTIMQVRDGRFVAKE